MQSEPRNARVSVWALPRSLAATYGIILIFSSSGYLDVSVHRVPTVHLWIQCTVHKVFSCGFPHSDICGSLDICSSPQLFAAYHVFLRLSVPRHPPYALLRFTTKSTFLSKSLRISSVRYLSIFRCSLILLIFSVSCHISMTTVCFVIFLLLLITNFSDVLTLLLTRTAKSKVIGFLSLLIKSNVLLF